MEHRLSTAAGLAATVVAGLAGPVLVATSSQAATTKVAARAKTSATVKVQFTGPAVDTRWGPVQVALSVAGGRIVDVSVPVYPNHKRRSALINDRALPVYRDEALTAQSANISNVSGATYTWEGYTASLQAAIDTARAKGALS